MADVVGEEAPAGWRTEQGVVFRRGFSRPRCTNGWADGMAVGNHGLETRLSEMWGKLRKYPHRFEAVLSVQGYHGHFACLDFTGGGSFHAHCNFRIARHGLRWRELSEHNETKIYLKYFGLTRRGLKFPYKPNMYCTKSMRTTNVIQNFEFMLCSIKNFATCIMHATYYSNERFSAFQTYILPLQYELNLNSFLYLNKIYSNDCCEVKAFEFVSLF